MLLPTSVIRQACIKITNEPPSGVKANLHEALNCFDQERLESCAKENEFRKILFSLVYVGVAFTTLYFTLYFLDEHCLT